MKSDSFLGNSSYVSFGGLLRDDAGLMEALLCFALLCIFRYIGPPSMVMVKVGGYQVRMASLRCGTQQAQRAINEGVLQMLAHICILFLAL